MSGTENENATVASTETGASPARPPERVVWPEATERLRADPSFGPLVERVGPVRLRPSRGEAFQALAAAIVYQQLAGAAARTVHGRFVAALAGEVTPENVLSADDGTLRGAGLSGAKMRAIRDLAAKAVSGEVPLHDLASLTDEKVVERLVRVKGIGPWTAHMYLLFDLVRPDVWPVGDLGVRAGIARVLGLAEPPSPLEMAWIGVGYRPWRSAVAWYCWRAVDTITQDAG